MNKSSAYSLTNQVHFYKFCCRKLNFEFTPKITTNYYGQLSHIIEKEIFLKLWQKKVTAKFR